MKHTKLIEPINEAQTYNGWSDEPLESGYYICVDTDYSYQGTGEEVAYIGTEEEAMEAQHSSEGHVEGPFASEEEAREEAINQGYRLLGESKQKRTVTLSEAQLRKVITESVKRALNEEMRMPRKERSGYTSNDGNPMVGGKWGAYERYFTVDVTDKLYEEVESTFEGESEEICDYIYRNEELFKLKGIISCSYDESVGVAMNMPDYEIEEIDTEEAQQCLSEYPDENVAQQLVQIFNTIVDNINVDEVEMIEQD